MLVGFVESLKVASREVRWELETLSSVGDKSNEQESSMEE